MAKNAFDRMVRSLPALYRAEVNTMLRGLLQSWSFQDDDVCVQLKNTKDQLFVTKAEGTNLDSLGSNVGVNRSPELGIDDKDYSGLIPVLSFLPKQVRGTVVSLLDVFWGAGFTRPNISSGNIQNFNFGPETNLTGQVTFTKDTKIVRGVGTLFTTELVPGDYIKPTASNGNSYVKVSAIIDDTTLLLSLPWTENAAVNVASQKGVTRTLDYKVDGTTERTIRFTPNAFEDISDIPVQELVDFINSNIEHNVNITASEFVDPILGTKLNIRTNTPGLQGSIQITGGDANDPTRLNFDTSLATDTRAKVLEVNPNEVVVQIPSSVPVLRRALQGSAHPRDVKTTISSDKEMFDFSGLGASSTLDVTIDGNNFTVTFTHSEFADSSAVTAEEVAEAINTQLTDLNATTGLTKVVTLSTTNGSLEYQVTGGTANAILNFDTALQQDPALIETNFPSAYVFDPINQQFKVTGVNSTLASPVVGGTVSSTINLADAASFPNQPGKVILDFGRSTQEGPIDYTSRPNNSTLLIDASYQFQFNHSSGRTVNLVEAGGVTPRLTGLDYAFFVTGTEEARAEAQELIKKLLAAGVVVRFVIDFPEYLFECVCRDCGPGIGPDQRGSLTGQGPLEF